MVFDNDNALYEEPDNAKEYHTKAAIKAVQKQLPHLTDDDVIQLMQKSKREYNGSLEIFSTEHNIDLRALRTDHYENLIRSTEDNDFFDPTRVPKEELLTLIETDVTLAIATHGNKEWTSHSLKKNELSLMFNQVSIITKGMVNIGKSTGPQMYDAVLDSTCAPETEDPAERGFGYAMIEDTPENLKFAKDRGMTTILINPNLTESDEIPDYIDVVVRNNHDAARCIIDSNALNNVNTCNADIIHNQRTID